MSSFMLSPLAGRVVGPGALRSSSGTARLRSAVTDHPVRTRAVAEEVSVPLIPTIGDEVAPFTPPVPEDLPQTTYNLSKKLSTSSYPGLNPKPAVTASEPKLPDLPDLPDLSAANKAVADAAADAQAAASQLAGNVTGALDGLTGSVSSGLSGINDSLSSGLSGVAGTFSSGLSGVTAGLSGATESVSTGLSGLTGKALEASRQLSSTLSSTTGGVSDRVGESTQVAKQTLGAAVSIVSDAVGGANSVVGGTVAAVEQAAAQASGQLLSSLPPEGREALEAVAQGAGSAAAIAASHPAEASLVAGLVALPLLSAWYTDSFAGYGGELDGEQVRSLLVSDEKPALLVDIREDEERSAAGVPELKLGARFKAVALPLSLADPLVPESLVRQVKSREQLRLAVSAALISGLKQVKSQLDVVVIMDSRGDKVAKELARALRKEGLFQAYVLKGGFSGWLKSGLPVEQSPDYQANAAAFIKDEVEVVSRQASAFLSEASKPEVGLPLVGASALAVVAVLNYHVTLQVIGLWGLAFSVYNGSAAALLKGVASGAAKVTASASSVAAKSAASKPAPSKPAAAKKPAVTPVVAREAAPPAPKDTAESPAAAPAPVEAAVAAPAPEKQPSAPEQGVKEPMEQLSS